jgi:NADH-quinone oxidoreductase subunit M
MGCLLTWTILLPILGIVMVLLVPSHKTALQQKIGAYASFATFLLSVFLFSQFEIGRGDYQFVEKVSWIPAYGIQYLIGLDGLSMLMFVLTTLLTWISLVSSAHSITARKKEFIMSILVLETAMLERSHH